MSSARGKKRDREIALQERAARKRSRRQSRVDADGTEVDEATPVDQASYSEAELLAELADLHKRHDDERITDDDFTTARDDLLRQLRI